MCNPNDLPFSYSVVDMVAENRSIVPHWKSCIIEFCAGFLFGITLASFLFYITYSPATLNSSQLLEDPRAPSPDQTSVSKMVAHFYEALIGASGTKLPVSRHSPHENDDHAEGKLKAQRLAKPEDQSGPVYI